MTGTAARVTAASCAHVQGCLPVDCDVKPKHCCRWLKGRTARSFLGFLLALNEAVRGRRLSEPCDTSPAVEALLKVKATSQSLSLWQSMSSGSSSSRSCYWLLLQLDIALLDCRAQQSQGQ